MICGVAAGTEVVDGVTCGGGAEGLVDADLSRISFPPKTRRMQFITARTVMIVICGAVIPKYRFPRGGFPEYTFGHSPFTLCDQLSGCGYERRPTARASAAAVTRETTL